MNHSFDDIRDAIARAPSWFDDGGVPRYCEFRPWQLADIYANEAALLLIACQGCGHEFKVSVSLNSFDRYIRSPGRKLLADLIKERAVGYGDPPNIGCCASGPTMTSDTKRVLEFWRREKIEWQRDPSLEIEIE